jgi:hypothetical protein
VSFELKHGLRRFIRKELGAVQTMWCLTAYWMSSAVDLMFSSAIA